MAIEMLAGGEEHLTGGEDQAVKLVDKDGNGLDGGDIPFPPGSLEAKKAWAQIDADAHSPANVAKAKQLHPDAIGMYKGKALVPGPGENQGDYDFLVDKLVYSKGFSPEVASKIAGSVKFKLMKAAGGR